MNKNKFKKILNFFNPEDASKIYLTAIINIILIGIFGLTINASIQKRQQARDINFSYFTFKLQKKDETVNQVSRSINSRYIASDRVLSKPSSEKYWEDYLDSVSEWNIEYGSMRANLTNYFGWEFTQILINEKNDSSSIIPQSLYYKFVKLHYLLIDLRNGNYNKRKEASELLDSIKNQKDNLITLMIEDIKSQKFSLNKK